MSIVYGGLTYVCSRHGKFFDAWGTATCPACTWDAINGKLLVGKITEGQTMSESIASFRFRLREASRLALELGDTLLQFSQDAAEPNATQLGELRSIENSLDVLVRYRAKDVTRGDIRDPALAAQ